MYFQKQGSFSSLCGVHAVNNLLGGKIYSDKTFNQISDYLYEQTKSLGCPTRNRNYIGGDFDANVIITAIQNYGLQCKWIDSRSEYQYKYQESTFLKGYIINVELQTKTIMHRMLSLSGRHWICLKLQKDGSFYICDSKNSHPSLLQDFTSYINFIRQMGHQILQIRKRIQEDQKDQPKVNVKNADKTINSNNKTINLNSNRKDEFRDDQQFKKKQFQQISEQKFKKIDKRQEQSEQQCFININQSNIECIQDQTSLKLQHSMFQQNKKYYFQDIVFDDLIQKQLYQEMLEQQKTQKIINDISLEQ